MPTSRRSKTDERFAGMASALAWGAWTELGISGWSRTHADWAVDLEPLIVLTASLADEDPRLRDEATDWCIRNSRYVSRVRLKNLLRAQPATTKQPFGEFAATVGAHAGTPWPGGGSPRPYTPTGRSSAPALERPSMAWLRLRAMFGVGARSEILRVMLSATGAPLSVAAIAEATGFTKRNVADECDSLAAAGVLAVRVQGNRFYYSLAKAAALAAFVGDLPQVRPSWPALLAVTQHLVLLERRAEQGNPKTLAVDVSKTLRLIADDVHELDLPLADLGVSIEELWPTTMELGQAWLAAWSSGHWPEGSLMPRGITDDRPNSRVGATPSALRP